MVLGGTVAALMVCCLGVVQAVQGNRLSHACSLPEAKRADGGRVSGRTVLGIFSDDPLQDASGPDSKQRYNYTTWMKRNTANLLRNLGSEHPVEVEGSKVCLMFIPVGTNCKPAIGIMAEKDVHRLKKFGSQFVALSQTIKNDAFMIECVNKIMWFKWSRIDV